MTDGKRWRVRRVVWIVLLVLAAGVIVRIVTWRNPGVIISPETTFITGPLREDGTVDYLAAINERCSQGVTPENNAAVLLLQALGPEAIPQQDRERFFQMLGIDPLPGKGPYLEDCDDYFGRKTPRTNPPTGGRESDGLDRAQEEYDRILSRPWTKAESPLAAAWLEENQRQIDLVVAATWRQRFYSPLLPGPDEQGLLDRRLDSVPPSKRAARALLARALCHVGEGKTDEAWQDLLACHRLARLVDQGPSIVDGLVATVVEGTAVEGDAVLAHEGKLSAEQARRFAAELGRLPPLTKMADRLNWVERLTYLDLVVAITRGGASRDAAINAVLEEEKSIPLARQVDIALTDWNEPMRIGNHVFDQVAAAMSKPTRQERLAAFADAWRDFQPVFDQAKGDRSTFRKLLSAVGLAGDARRQMAASVAGPAFLLIEYETDAEDKATVRRDMAQLVFALAAYRAEHGEYPANLAALVPKDIPAVPEDVFGAGPLRYRREGEGYVLYSVGPNGVDDGGRNRSDEPDDPKARDCDDIAIRVPAKGK